MCFNILTYAYAIAELQLDYTLWNFIMASDAMMQPNSFDCGVFVCLHGASLILKQKVPFTSSKNSRKWVKWVLSRRLDFRKSKPRQQLIGPRTLDLLKVSSEVSIEWSSKEVFPEILNSITHDKVIEICSNALCSRPKSSTRMDMCVVCRRWYHDICHKKIVASYFVCAFCSIHELK